MVLELNAFVVMPNHIHGIIHYQNIPSKISDRGIVGAALAAARNPYITRAAARAAPTTVTIIIFGKLIVLNETR